MPGTCSGHTQLSHGGPPHGHQFRWAMLLTVLSTALGVWHCGGHAWGRWAGCSGDPGTYHQSQGVEPHALDYTLLAVLLRAASSGQHPAWVPRTHVLAALGPDPNILFFPALLPVPSLWTLGLHVPSQQPHGVQSPRRAYGQARAPFARCCVSFLAEKPPGVTQVPCLIFQLGKWAWALTSLGHP